MKRDEVAVSGVWLYTEVDETYESGPDRFVVSVEVGGEWRRCIVEPTNGPASHIIEPAGIRARPRDERVYDERFDVRRR
jgi:hypothetical protein